MCSKLVGGLSLSGYGHLHRAPSASLLSPPRAARHRRLHRTSTTHYSHYYIYRNYRERTYRGLAAVVRTGPTHTRQPIPAAKLRGPNHHDPWHAPTIGAYRCGETMAIRRKLRKITRFDRNGQTSRSCLVCMQGLPVPPTSCHTTSNQPSIQL
jgi:hypothetical protein